MEERKIRVISSIDDSDIVEEELIAFLDKGKFFLAGNTSIEYLNRLVIESVKSIGEIFIDTYYFKAETIQETFRFIIDDAMALIEFNFWNCIKDERILNKIPDVVLEGDSFNGELVIGVSKVTSKTMGLMSKIFLIRMLGSILINVGNLFIKKQTFKYSEISAYFYNDINQAYDELLEEYVKKQN